MTSPELALESERLMWNVLMHAQHIAPHGIEIINNTRGGIGTENIGTENIGTENISRKRERANAKWEANSSSDHN